MCHKVYVSGVRMCVAMCGEHAQPTRSYIAVLHSAGPDSV